MYQSQNYNSYILDPITNGNTSVDVPSVDEIWMAPVAPATES